MNRRSRHSLTPLKGVRIVEFCNVAAGPFCAMLLGDMGADVIKVESKVGDTLREWPPINDGFSENFASLNRNKRSIALDLKDSADRDIAQRLIESADVVVENNRPGVMSRLGLGYEAFADNHPRLIYCSLSACGQDGPRASDGGFDLTIQAMSGIMSVTGEANGDAVKAGVPVSDFATGLYGAFSIASLLAHVRAGGGGGHIDVSMLGSSLAISALQISEYFGSGLNPGRLGAAHPRNAPYQAFKASDGSFVMAAGNDKLWRSVCKVIGCLDLADDVRFRTTLDRAANQLELATIMNAIFVRMKLGDVISAFEQEGVPCSRINTYSEALDDPQVDFMGWVRVVKLPTGRSTRIFGSAISIDGISPPITRVPPALDADRTNILQELSRLNGAGRVTATTDAGHVETRHGRNRLNPFLAALTKLADEAIEDEAVLTARVGEALKLLVRYDNWLDDEFAMPDARCYRQYLLYCDPLSRFSVVSFVWGPGQQTPIHDHTTWGLIGMLRGAELSESFEIRDGKPIGTGVQRLEPGEVALVSPTIGDIHRVWNAFQDRVSISIHVYGGDIGAIQRHVYTEEGNIKMFVSGYANRVLPNIWGAQ
jgi:crotonobetainyl-CoA:carnitine CoA-transferase CaiB-like acyl-CoA transferase/predicted metal-dependent enzyme (double-stranded beta helix superfamily)